MTLMSNSKTFYISSYILVFASLNSGLYKFISIHGETYNLPFALKFLKVQVVLSHIQYSRVWKLESVPLFYGERDPDLISFCSLE